HVGIRAAPTLVAQKDQGESGSDLRSPAISVARTTPYLSSLRLEDRCCAAIVSAPIVQPSKEFKRSQNELSPTEQPLALSAAGVICRVRPLSYVDFRERN